MNDHRFQDLLSAEDQPTQTATATAFVLCPVALQNWGGAPCPWEQLYRAAYEKARAVTRPSIVERLQANLLN